MITAQLLASSTRMRNILVRRDESAPTGLLPLSQMERSKMADLLRKAAINITQNYDRACIKNIADAMDIVRLSNGVMNKMAEQRVMAAPLLNKAILQTLLK